jgi:hypothetical protein
VSVLLLVLAWLYAAVMAAAMIALAIAEHRLRKRLFRRKS